MSVPRPTGVHHEQHHRHLVHTVPLGLVPGRTLAVSVDLLTLGVVLQTLVSVGYLGAGGPITPFTLVALSVPAMVVQLGLGYLFVTRRLGGVRAVAPSRADLSLVAAGSVAVLVVTLGGNALLAAVGLEALPDAMLALATSEPLVFVVFAVRSVC